MSRGRRQGKGFPNPSRSIEALLAPAAIVGWAAGCSPASTACVDTGMCVSEAAAIDASTAEAGNFVEAGLPLDSGAPEAGTVDAPPEAAACDPTQDPKDEPCVLDDAYGVFVAPAAAAGEAGAPDGDAADAVAPDAETGEGTQARPFASIGEALAHRNGKSRIYVCNGTYTESVTVTSPVTIYGGLSCTREAWRWVGGVALVTAPPVSNAAPSFALSVNGTAGPVTLQDMGFVASDGAGFDSRGNGASSVAAFVQNATVTLTRCLLRSGKGARGADGITQPSNYSSAAGPAPSGGIGDNPGTITCQSKSDGVTFDSSTGGAGGLAASGSGVGGDGTAHPAPVFVDGVTPAGHDGKGSGWPGAGDPGEDGAGKPGGPSASGPGTLTAAGWVPTGGADGLPGLPGQGGGGGPLAAGQNPQDGSAGGAGGCGGAAGTGGTGGGASIALVSVASVVTLKACTLVTDRGGDGGNGGAGQNGQSGGAGGPVTTAGTGGNGAGGSGGGGGSAGISVGIVYSPGSLPAYDPNDTSIAHGAAGIGGSGGQPGTGPGATVLATGIGATGYVDPNAAGATLLAPLLP